MNWKLLNEEGQLAEIKEESTDKFILIFKHSTRCSTSALAINRLEREWQDHEMDTYFPYFLDVIRYRNISNGVAHIFSIEHESPQVLVIKDGNCIYNNSHLGIAYSEIKKLKDKISV